MTRFVALLRAVNVGGRAQVAMADLRAQATAIGLRDPNTLLQSGNLLFQADDVPTADLEARLETVLRVALGLHTIVLVRAAAAWQALVDDLPFPDLARVDPSHVVAMPLRAAPDAARCADFGAALQGGERVEVRGTTAFLAYPDGIGRSKLTPSLIERRLATQGTGRNWRTVLKIRAALAA